MMLFRQRKSRWIVKYCGKMSVLFFRLYLGPCMFVSVAVSALSVFVFLFSCFLSFKSSHASNSVHGFRTSWVYTNFTCMYTKGMIKISVYTNNRFLLCLASRNEEILFCRLIPRVCTSVLCKERVLFLWLPFKKGHNCIAVLRVPRKNTIPYTCSVLVSRKREREKKSSVCFLVLHSVRTVLAKYVFRCSLL